MECHVIFGDGSFHVCVCMVLGFILGCVFMGSVFGFIFGLAQDNEAFEKHHAHKQYIPYNSVFGNIARKQIAKT